ncbi:MAG: lipoyl synthase [Leptospiraceae bacterium]|nr:lipoyl synthase [Leptospiraceae bacterium]MCK6380521.1 lipoyl synthase [Leptospiraceae bacterium]NUM41053.1 lipoyl synthase [Leptospiraceae bacterium]
MNPLKKKPRTHSVQNPPPKPNWLKVHLSFPTKENAVQNVRESLEKSKLNTVCESASCPNLNHCWSNKTATYMILGDICTRRCHYCDVPSGKPGFIDIDEPKKIADSVQELNLNHVVITSVNRDDLKDGGATHYSNVISEIRKVSNSVIEILIPDFKNKLESLEIVCNAKPDIINHNIETVQSFFPVVAPQKNYKTSLEVLQYFFEKGFTTKSGIMLGFGESIEEVKDCLQDLRKVNVKMITIGQYLQPSPTHYPVFEYVPKNIFSFLKQYALEIGFTNVESGPLVRSSYHAKEQAKEVL